MAKRWYIIHVYSGFEKKVRDEVVRQSEQKGLTSSFDEVLVPMEQVEEVKRGKKVAAERKFFPGYVLVKMELTDETNSFIRNIAKVTGFLGPGGKPSPIPDHEALRIMSQVEEGKEHPKPSIAFMIGDTVRVADGPFASFTGTVEEVDDAKGRVKVLVSIFGRPTPVELEYSQVERQ